MNPQQVITELQTKGLNLVTDTVGASGRKGGAGPSDHKAVTIGETTFMVPVYTDGAAQSPYSVDSKSGQSVLTKDNQIITALDFPEQPKFYNLTTADGIPYWKIALLHSRNVLATTVLQTCIRYENRKTACQFCAIGESLAADRTIAQKTPQQLAEVAAAAVRLDGVENMIMTTGTPNTTDRGAAYLTDCAQAIQARVDLPIQAQCEPPNDFVWFERMRSAGIDSLGMHLEAADSEVRSRIMPGKARVPLSYYFKAFESATNVFGRGQVSTYLLAGLGDSKETLLDISERLINIGVYPFVVPFVPISGTPLAHHQPPSSEFMYDLYQGIGQLLKRANLLSSEMKAGCAKCGACSALSLFEN
ncbi:MSMEG_0568 family radical SAM protein [Leptolyngbya cf. ectocarpi LEGE 11479]|uniref:MSMEG_0568 family radical SAM protein n=1 Tax=Leptolyngbya cf. ectocarpi LEGE 11479 TaxID=1828722 RepID=A0A928ZXM7_LEPEC|nr:MSMEG_0568 family radical SAM protein [Leptolyngbya ectocarpi]MBE9069331.1 MSMEG_0568 family radical SAM protein [Leptolyngbya cf. ectocarpi LEGE 11479]